MGERIEFDDILNFAEGEDLEDASKVKKLRLMWTGFCNQEDMEPDTYAYDQKIMAIWETMQDNPTCPYSSLDFERFDMMMCKHLV